MEPTPIAMGLYDDRRATLDPGLTVLALRARRDAKGRYPFVDEASRSRTGWLAALATRLSAWGRGRGRDRTPGSPPDHGGPPVV